VYINSLDKFSGKIHVNDYISDLMCVQEQLIYSLDIIDVVKNIQINSQDDYINVRQQYNSSPTPEHLWALMMSCTNNMLRFNKAGKFNQTYGKRKFNSATEEKAISFHNMGYPHRKRIKFTYGHFNYVPVTSDTFVYIDPPYGYIDVNGKMGNTQISEAGYNAFWDKSDEEILLKYILDADKIGASVMVSGVLVHKSKVSWILNTLINMGYPHRTITCDYNKVSRVDSSDTSEIILTNYEIPVDNAFDV